MLEYAKKRAMKIDMPLLQYVGAFGEGAVGKSINAYRRGCPKLLRAYRDGVRMKKRA